MSKGTWTALDVECARIGKRQRYDCFVLDRYVNDCCQSDRTWRDIGEFLTHSAARRQANEGNLEPTRESSQH